MPWVQGIIDPCKTSPYITELTPTSRMLVLKVREVRGVGMEFLTCFWDSQRQLVAHCGKEEVRLEMNLWSDSAQPAWEPFHCGKIPGGWCLCVNTAALWRIAWTFSHDWHLSLWWLKSHLLLITDISLLNLFNTQNLEQMFLSCHFLFGCVWISFYLFSTSASRILCPLILFPIDNFSQTYYL